MRDRTTLMIGIEGSADHNSAAERAITLAKQGGNVVLRYVLPEPFTADTPESPQSAVSYLATIQTAMVCDDLEVLPLASVQFQRRAEATRKFLGIAGDSL